MAYTVLCGNKHDRNYFQSPLKRWTMCCALVHQKPNPRDFVSLPGDLIPSHADEIQPSMRIDTSTGYQGHQEKACPDIERTAHRTCFSPSSSNLSQMHRVPPRYNDRGHFYPTHAISGSIHVH